MSLFCIKHFMKVSFPLLFLLLFPIFLVWLRFNASILPNEMEKQNNFQSTFFHFSSFPKYFSILIQNFISRQNLKCKKSNSIIFLSNKEIKLNFKDQQIFDDDDENDAKSANKKRKDDEPVKEAEIQRKSERGCPGNSSRNSKGECECDKGYFGFPNDQRGCFKCQQQCYEDELCVYPGVCSCGFGQMRASNDECVPASLRIVKAHPTLLERHFTGSIIVEVVPKEVTIRPLFCKFGHTVVSAAKGSKPGEILCPMPIIKKLGDTRLYVSDDRGQWPANGVLIRITKSAGNEYTNDVIMGSFFSTLMCLFLFYVYYKFFRSETARAARKRTENEAYN